MKQFGLIGKKLGHSFSKKYFTDKFDQEQLPENQYDLFELFSISEFPDLLKQHKNLCGLNVTIPYKQEVIPYLDRLAPSAEKTAAVNVIKVEQDGSLSGHNSDYYGFKTSLERFIEGTKEPLKALVLGTGGAAKAVQAALKDLEIPFQMISRTEKAEVLSYDQLKPEVVRENLLIINTTPLGMYPEVDRCPPLPYEAIGPAHYIFDLVYNPETTLLMQKGQAAGAQVKNGLEMLHLQAERSWEIWNA